MGEQFPKRLNYTYVHVTHYMLLASSSAMLIERMGNYGILNLDKTSQTVLVSSIVAINSVLNVAHIFYIAIGILGKEMQW